MLHTHTRTAAALIIGNELLTGKIQDANTHFLAQELFQLGIVLRRVVVCPDEMQVIIDDVNALRASHDMVFTSGGVGPTHDDITMDAIAAALGRDVVRSPKVARIIRHVYGERTTEAHLRMANMPEGSEMVQSAKAPWPALVCENVFILPGVPEIFRRKFELLKARLDDGTRFHNHTVYTWCDEGAIAKTLAEVSERFPEVTVGSYLLLNNAAYRVKLTFDGVALAQVQAAADAFVAGIKPEDLVRRESSAE